MKRREFITLLGGTATANVSWPMTTRAQVPERHIGVLMGLAEDDRDTKARLSGLLQGLEKLGWVEGRNVRIDIALRLQALALKCSRRNWSNCDQT